MEATNDCSDPGGHIVDHCSACDRCFCVICDMVWERPGAKTVLYPTFYWPGKGYVTTGGCMAMFDAGAAQGPIEGCH
jgi:hypothetical protein